MIGSYSRIKQVDKKRSKSIDLSDLSFPSSQTTKSITNRQNNPRMPESIPEHENEDGKGEIFGEILSKKGFVPSSLKDRSEKSYIQTVVNSSLSLRRSSSVSEGYSRIHHQYNLTATAAADDDRDHDECRKNSDLRAKSMKKKGKIVQACRRLLGL